MYAKIYICIWAPSDTPQYQTTTVKSKSVFILWLFGQTKREDSWENTAVICNVSYLSSSAEERINFGIITYEYESLTFWVWAMNSSLFTEIYQTWTLIGV